MKNWQRYPEYQDSGVEWLGKIPKGWKKVCIKYLLHQIIDTEHKTAPFEADGQYLVVRTSNVRNGKLCLDNAKYTDIDGFNEWTRRGTPQPEDILFTREAPAGEACLVPDNLSLCLGQRMVLFRVNHQRLNPKYGIWSIYGGLANEFIILLSQGTTVVHFNMADIRNIPLLVPPLPEQKTIAHFLDRETTKLDNLIAKKERFIELLQEKRTALISHAVTKGLNPDVPMKDSGVEWLGQIPQHWEFVRFSHFINFQEGPGIMADDFKDEGVPLLRITNLQPGYVDLEGCNYLEIEKVENKWKHFKLLSNDLLISCSASTGLLSVIDSQSAGSIAYTGIIRLRPARNNILINFIKVLVESQFYLTQIEQLKTGTTIKHYGPIHLKQIRIPLPPLPEQKAIAHFLDQETAKIDSLIEKTKTSIEKLKEYRTALISAAVTGKIDVREEVV